MVIFRLKEVCKNCPHIDVVVTNKKLHPTSYSLKSDVDIFCSHQAVCKFYEKEADVEWVTQNWSE